MRLLASGGTRALRVCRDCGCGGGVLRWRCGEQEAQQRTLSELCRKFEQSGLF